MQRDGAHIVVVGGGLAGLMAALKIAERGVCAHVFSLIAVRRSHSVCAQGGINAAVNVKGEDDSPELHFRDTIRGGDFLADQPLPRGMCYAAPGIINLLDRMGVPFNRTPEGRLDFRRFGGTLYHRTAFAGASTGQQMLYALDEQARRFEAEGLVEKHEDQEVLDIVRDDEGACCGIVVMDLKTMELRAVGADAVLIATGGCGAIFGKSTNSILTTGSLASAAYQRGAKFANGEFVQVHPTAIPGYDKCRLISESARGEGGRVWVPARRGDTRPPAEIPESERCYFLEQKYPKYGNLVPRDIATQEIFKICVEEQLGVDGELAVYLDLTHIDHVKLESRLGSLIDLYLTYVGEDPRRVPMKIFPAVHYSMGGLWVGYACRPDGFPDAANPKTHMTSVPGLYALGEADGQYHGANRLGANALLACIYSGMLAGPAAVSRVKNMRRHPSAAAALERAAQRWRERFDALRRADGPENPFRLHDELGAVMLQNVTIVRRNDALRATDAKIIELMERWRRIKVPDGGAGLNRSLVFTNQLWNMLELARVITLGALRRDESRGAHYKPEFPARDDAQWLKTTLATWTPAGPELTYEPVDTSLVQPEARHYE